MPDAAIDNPILNGPYDEPTRHWKFDDDGITDEVVSARRASGYFVPVPAARKRTRQLTLQTQWTRDRLKSNDLVNQIRARLHLWRKRGRLTSPPRHVR